MQSHNQHSTENAWVVCSNDWRETSLVALSEVYSHQKPMIRRRDPTAVAAWVLRGSRGVAKYQKTATEHVGLPRSIIIIFSTLKDETHLADLLIVPLKEQKLKAEITKMPAYLLKQLLVQYLVQGFVYQHCLKQGK